MWRATYYHYSAFYVCFDALFIYDHLLFSGFSFSGQWSVKEEGEEKEEEEEEKEEGEEEAEEEEKEEEEEEEKRWLTRLFFGLPLTPISFLISGGWKKGWGEGGGTREVLSISDI